MENLNTEQDSSKPLEKCVSKSFEEKCEIFIVEYLKDGNGTRAAVAAGWSQNRARQTASELLKRPDIAAKIKQVDQLDKRMLTDAPESIESMLETDIPKALRYMASQSQNDPDSAKKFLDMALKFTSKKEELLGNYAECSTGELLLDVDQTIKEIEELRPQLLELIKDE